MTSDKIDICMTATIRPSILIETLSSFTTNMFTDKSRYKLIINIDPIGESGVPIKKIIKICRNFFDDIEYNCPPTPSFTTAVQWCWSRTKSKYIFHLEDDWKLLIPINIDWMIDILNNTDRLKSLRLNKEKTGKSKHSLKFGFVYYPKISLNPTLFDGEFIRTIYPLMDLTRNPEKQLRPNKTPRGKYISTTHHAIYTKQSVYKVVADIGRTWMNNSKYTKNTGFMNWEIKK